MDILKLRAKWRKEHEARKGTLLGRVENFLRGILGLVGLLVIIFGVAIALGLFFGVALLIIKMVAGIP